MNKVYRVIFAALKVPRKFFGFSLAPIGFASANALHHFNGAGAIRPPTKSGLLGHPPNVRPCPHPSSLAGVYSPKYQFLIISILEAGHNDLGIADECGLKSAILLFLIRLLLWSY